MIEHEPPTRRALRHPETAPDEVAVGAAPPEPVPEPSRVDPVVAVIEPASPDVVSPGESPAMPGEHRGGFARELTAPVEVTRFEHDELEPEPGWTPTGTIPARTRRGSLAAGALGLAIAGLALSVFVVWGLLLGLAAVVLAARALRRQLPHRAAAIWALALGALATLYGAGWLVWGILRLTGAVA
ncbi:hypothetical protein ABCS02_22040 [Microbacterium sp. X-17]|uniref:hypothetical protein n=1 Tax=Microbacterium sp. X-17 TaxID=3144404 RepID=UPI0031F5B43B